MNTLSLTDKTKDRMDAHAIEQQLSEAWFDEPPPSQRRQSSRPPVEHVGEFLGDPLADAWLR